MRLTLAYATPPLRLCPPALPLAIGMPLALNAEYFYCCYTGRLLRISWSPSELPPSDAPLEFVADQSAGAPKLKFLDVFGQDLPIMGEKARWSKDGAVKVIDLAFDSVKAALDDDALTDGDMFFLQCARLLRVRIPSLHQPTKRAVPTTSLTASALVRPLPACLPGWLQQTRPRASSWRT